MLRDQRLVASHTLLAELIGERLIAVELRFRRLFASRIAFIDFMEIPATGKHFTVKGRNH